MRFRGFLRRRRLRVALGLALLLSVSVFALIDGPAPGPRDGPPNILVFLTDQERPPLQLPEIPRPHLARLAQSGVVFEQAFVPFPACSPARASLLTGLYPQQTGVVENVDRARHGAPLDPSVPNLGSVLAAAGYDTGYFGKWHLSAPEHVEDYGFAEVFVPEKWHPAAKTPGATTSASIST